MDRYTPLATLVADAWAAIAGRAEAATSVAADSAEGWALIPAGVGRNGVVFRAERPGEVCAAKVSPDDDRSRGAREHAALCLLRDTAAGTAPQPRALVTRPDGLPVTVLVSSWLDGSTAAAMVAAGRREPDGLAGDLVDLLAAVHTGTRHAADHLRLAVYVTPAQLFERTRWYAARAADPHVDALVERAHSRLAGAAGNGAPPALVHGDVNLANVLVTPGGLRLVDWENAGRGDPCLDMADMCVHPGAFGGEPDRWPELIDRHTRGLGHPTAARRTWFYGRLLTVLWAAISRAEAYRPRVRMAGTGGHSATVLTEQADRYIELAWTLLGRH